MVVFHNNLLAFAKGYIEEAGSLLEEVTFERASSPIALVDLSGCTCLRTQRSGLGYDIMEYERPDPREKFLLILDRMSGDWVLVQ